jgi:hypothetical protein
MGKDGPTLRQYGRKVKLESQKSDVLADDQISYGRNSTLGGQSMTRVIEDISVKQLIKTFANGKFDRTELNRLTTYV